MQIKTLARRTGLSAATIRYDESIGLLPDPERLPNGYRAYGDEDEACRPFVDEESRSTRSLDESLGWNEEAFKAFVKMLPGSVAHFSDVVNVYRDHHPRYLALSARLAQTDRLIDEVVYRLYGLTEEEIAIVEGGHAAHGWAI